PSERAAEIALRTQQVLMEETGITNVADPLGGSWYVEQLTDAIEAEAEKIFDQIKQWSAVDHPIGPMTSGILHGIDEGWFMSEIAESAFQYQAALEKGEKKIVGINCHTNTLTEDLEILRVSHEVETVQVATLAERRNARDKSAVDAAIAHMVDVARTDGNMVVPMMDAVRAEATLGEICGALRAEWGEYREPARF
ncbi:MAG: methylmalonyl-CoA mutase family protein, partial [Aeromicrobium sp.]